MKKHILSLLFITTLQQSFCAYATTDMNSPHGWYLGAATGASFHNVSTNNFITSSTGWPSDQFHYQEANATALLSLLSGYTWTSTRHWFPSYSLGANYTYAFPAKVLGQVTQYSLPAFNNYNFQYQVQRQTLLAVFKTDIYRWHNIMPFVSAGAGFSVNRASGYAEQPQPGVTGRTSPNFGSNTSTHFSYAVGAGVDFIVQQNLLLSLEYNYGYFGHVYTGHDNIDYQNQRLSTRLSANTLAVSVNYFFDKTV